MFRIYGPTDDLYVEKMASLCHRYGVEYEICSTEIEENLIYLYERGHYQVPQVFEDDQHIGSCDDLVEYISLVRKIEMRRDK